MRASGWLLLVALFLAGCDSGDPASGSPAGGFGELDAASGPDPAPPVVTGVALDSRIELARAWLDTSRMQYDAALVVATLQQTYGIAMTHDGATIYEGWMSTFADLGYPDFVGGMALFRRIYDGAASLDAGYLAAAYPMDQLTLHALYCDRTPVPAGYRDALMAQLDVGGYDTSHVLLALVFARSNDCPTGLSAADYAEVISQVAALADLDDGQITDLDIEAMTFLAAAGRLDLVQDDHFAAFLATQRPDGSWSGQVWLDGSGASAVSQHTTALGLWLLLARQANDGFRRLVPGAP